MFRWIFDELVHRGDKYFHLADFRSYVETQRMIDCTNISNDEIWWRKAILNVARIGKFSSDRTVHRVRPRHLAHRSLRKVFHTV